MLVEVNTGLVEDYIKVLNDLDEAYKVVIAIENKKTELSNIIRLETLKYIEDNYKDMDGEDFFDYIMEKEFPKSEEGKNLLADLVRCGLFASTFTKDGQFK